MMNNTCHSSICYTYNLFIWACFCSSIKFYRILQCMSYYQTPTNEYLVVIDTLPEANGFLNHFSPHLL